MSGPHRPIRSQAHPRRRRPGSLPVLAGIVVVGAIARLLSVGAPSEAVAPGPVVSITGGPGVTASGPLAGAASDPQPSGPVAPSSADASSPTSTSPGAPAPASPGGPTTAVGGRFGLGLLIADRGNDRLLIVDDAGRTLWQFPGPGSLPRGQAFSADDAFVAPDGRTIVANDETHQVVDRIDIASRRVVWQYGRYNQAGSSPGGLHTPDDAYPLANGDVTIADIRNCRVLEVSPGHRIVRVWGQTGDCRRQPPRSYADPNGDTPLPDGGMLITEIGGSRVVRLDAGGRVVFDIHVPVAYPSDAQLDPAGNILVVDYASPGAIVLVSPRGKLLWRYRPTSGVGRLDHPSLAILLPDGTIAVNDDMHDRVIVIDPRTNRIVWQYGHMGVAGRRPGYLRVPDGVNLVPLGTAL